MDEFSITQLQSFICMFSAWPVFDMAVRLESEVAKCDQQQSKADQQ